MPGDKFVTELGLYTPLDQTADSLVNICVTQLQQKNIQQTANDSNGIPNRQKIRCSMMTKKILKFCFGYCVLSLVACGGGSGDDNPPRSSSASVSSTSSISPPASSVQNSSAQSSSVQTSSIRASSQQASSVSSVPSSSSAATLAMPQNLSATPGNGSVTLSWSTVTNASSYHIYYATEANIQSQNIAAFDNGTWLQNVTPPHSIPGLSNGQVYYFVVTAVNGGRESAQSSEVSTTPSAVDLARQPTATEVLMLELVNRARFDPAGEAARYGIGLNDGLNPGTISATRKAPLAHNLFLIAAARTHSQWMLDADVFSHTGAGGNSMTDRMRTAGYSLSGGWAAGENIAWSGSSGNINLTQAVYGHHEGLFKSAGHRENILATGFREIGVGHKDGYFNTGDRDWRASMLTEKFARSGSSYFLTGVVYNDTNGDEFYNVGEGLAGITITINGQSHAVFSTGAFSIPVNNANYDLTISGAELGSPVSYSLQVNGANVKLDVIKSGSSVEVVSW